MQKSKHEHTAITMAVTTGYVRMQSMIELDRGPRPAPLGRLEAPYSLRG